MNEVIENKIIKESSGSGALTLVAVSLAASLSGPAVCYGFEEEPIARVSTFQSKDLNISEFNENVERLVQYTSDNYNESSYVRKESISEMDLHFLELSQHFSNNQVDIDSEIQDALNDFSKIAGAKPPRKNRF